MKRILYFFLLFTLLDSKWSLKPSSRNLSCQLPKYFRIGIIHQFGNLYSSQYISYKNKEGLICNVPNQDYKFDLNTWLMKTKHSNSCNTVKFSNYVRLKFPKPFILKKSFNLKELVYFLNLFFKWASISFINIHGFNCDSGPFIDYTKQKVFKLTEYIILNSKFDFFTSGKLVKSCRELDPFNITTFLQTDTRISLDLKFFNTKFRTPICPLVFQHARIKTLSISDMIDSFYKRNVLSFINESFSHLDSRIEVIHLLKTENINLDNKFLNPSVFVNLKSNFFF